MEIQVDNQKLVANCANTQPCVSINKTATEAPG